MRSEIEYAEHLLFCKAGTRKLSFVVRSDRDNKSKMLSSIWGM